MHTFVLCDSVKKKNATLHHILCVLNYKYPHIYLLIQKLIIVTVNVAFNKPAYQQNHVHKNYSTGDASNAVDGRKSDLTWSGGQCVISTTRETATWWVNLTSIHSIHHITVYYMTNNKSWGIVFFNSNWFEELFMSFIMQVKHTV